MARREQQPVPQELVERIEVALVAVDEARSALAVVVDSEQPREVRRQAHARVGAAFDEADLLLRRATRAARQHTHQKGFYLTWSRWRHLLSQLDMARQVYLFAEYDDQVLGLGTIRAIDTGMSGPAIGDLLHGESRAPGARATYGLDLEAVLTEADPAARARLLLPLPDVAPTATPAPPAAGEPEAA